MPRHLQEEPLISSGRDPSGVLLGSKMFEIGGDYLVDLGPINDRHQSGSVYSEGSQ